MHHLLAMIVTVGLLVVILPWVACSGEGNIRLLEEEVITAMKSCSIPREKGKVERQRRSDDSPNDDSTKEGSLYNHERRWSNDTYQVLNVTETENSSRSDEKTPEPRYVADDGNNNRTKRDVPLFDKGNADQCLSQCVFANLQVVDSRGIPREADLWNKVQSSVTSQQSRSALRDQIRACFQELQSEAEDNGCSYSNKLERCLMLRFADRQTNSSEASTQNSNQNNQN